MKCYFLTAHQTNVEVVGKIAAMKEDWETLSINQQIGCITKLFGDVVFSCENQQKIVQFVRTLNCTETSIGSMKVARTTHDNMLEFVVTITKETPSVMTEVSEEDYRHYVEDAQDELSK